VLNTIFIFNPQWKTEETSKFIGRLKILGWLCLLETEKKTLLKKGHRRIAIMFIDHEQITVTHWNTPTTSLH